MKLTVYFAQFHIGQCIKMIEFMLLIEKQFPILFLLFEVLLKIKLIYYSGS
jgi:hypothetical protein